MEQAPLLRCYDCKSSKTKDQFELRKRKNKYGEQGEPLSRCSSCAAKERERNEKKKRKRDEEGRDASGDPARPDRAISIDQFTSALHEQALTGVISFSARVSTQGLGVEEDGICTTIVGRVWEATGFRFTYGWFPLEGQWLILPLFNQVQDENYPEEWHCPAGV